MRGRPGRLRQQSFDHWIDVWAHLPEQLTAQIKQLALQRGVSLLEILEALLWLGLLRHEEVRRRRAGRLKAF